MPAKMPLKLIVLQKVPEIKQPSVCTYTNNDRLLSACVLRAQF